MLDLFRLVKITKCVRKVVPYPGTISCFYFISNYKNCIDNTLTAKFLYLSFVNKKLCNRFHLVSKIL